MTGLAVPTVSRALGGADDIGQKTRDLVQKTAQEIGYVPDRAGVRLRTGPRYVVSLVLSTETDAMNLTATLIRAAAGALRNTRYHPTTTQFFPDEDPADPIRNIVETKAADAAIINQIQPEDPRGKYLIDRQFPFVTHGRSVWADQHDYYDFDNHAFVRIAVRELAARGRKSLLVLAPPEGQFYAREMTEGGKKAANDSAIKFNVIPGVTSDSASEDIEIAVWHWLKAHPGTDGIICASSAGCMSAVTGVERASLAVARDIYLFAKEATPILGRFRKGILTQFEDAAAAGEFLAKSAVKRVEKPDTGLMQRLEPPADG